MSFQDPATHARARQQAGFRYGAARRQLARTIHERTGWHGPRAGRGPAPPEVSARQALAAEAVPLFETLARYVRRTLDDTIDRGEIGPQSVTPEDVVLATYLAAIEAAESAPSGGGVYPWLRRIARQRLGEAVAQQAERDLTERSLEAPVPFVEDEHWPEEALLLIDVLAAPDALVPEAIVQEADTVRTLDRLLARLPERWREVFLMSVVDGWPEAEVARAEGLPAGEVRAIVDACRAFLREWLRSAAEFGAV